MRRTHCGASVMKRRQKLVTDERWELIERRYVSLCIFFLPRCHVDRRPKAVACHDSPLGPIVPKLNEVLAGLPRTSIGKNRKPFGRMGTKSIFVAEGPGRQHDTQHVLSQSGYDQSLSDEKIQFVDLIETN